MNSNTNLRKNSNPFTLTLKEADIIDHTHECVLEFGEYLKITPSRSRNYGYVVQYRNMAFLVSARALSFERVWTNDFDGEFDLFLQVDMDGFLMSIRLESPQIWSFERE